MKAGSLNLLFLAVIWASVCSYDKDAVADSTIKYRRKRNDNPVHGNVCREKRAMARESGGTIRISAVRASSSFPYQASATLDTNCSAVVVTDRHVLTAAHCVVSRDRGVQSGGVRVGFLTTTGKLQWFPVKRIWHRKEWKKQDDPPAELDYALLVLKSKHRRPALQPLIVVNQTSFTKSNGTMHLLAFDYPHHPEQLLYRMCKADEAKDGLVYSNECYANEPANGAGVYTQIYDFENRKWRRVLVGILRGMSGEHQRMEIVWLTHDIMDTLCKWTRKTRYKLCDY